MNRPLPTPTQADIDRFLALVEVLPCGCLYWTGCRSRGKNRSTKWYGTFQYQGVRVRAHRFSCEFLKGEACPPGYHRDHTCEFSLCVAPDHIEVVSHAENERRKQERRGSRGESLAAIRARFTSTPRGEMIADRRTSA